jgi:hypothetical protein
MNTTISENQYCQIEKKLTFARIALKGVKFGSKIANSKKVLFKIKQPFFIIPQAQ